MIILETARHLRSQQHHTCAALACSFLDETTAFIMMPPGDSLAAETYAAWELGFLRSSRAIREGKDKNRKC